MGSIFGLFTRNPKKRHTLESTQRYDSVGHGVNILFWLEVAGMLSGVDGWPEAEVGWRGALVSQHVNILAKLPHKSKGPIFAELQFGMLLRWRLLRPRLPARSRQYGCCRNQLLRLGLKSSWHTLVLHFWFLIKIPFQKCFATFHSNPGSFPPCLISWSEATYVHVYLYLALDRPFAMWTPCWSKWRRSGDLVWIHHNRKKDSIFSILFLSLLHLLWRAKGW